MIITKPNVELWIPQSEIQHIARCASVCYGSKGIRIPNDVKDSELVNNLINNNHVSVFRHSSVYYIVPATYFSEDEYKYYTLIGLKNNPYVHIQYFDARYFISTNKQWEMENSLQAAMLSPYVVNENTFIEFNKKDKENLLRRLTFCITTQISTSRELNRVSPNNITEESTRFCNYSKDKYTNDITIVQPHWIDLFKDYDYESIKYDGKNLLATCGDFTLDITLNKFPIESYILNRNISAKAAKRFFGKLHKECTHYLETLNDGFAPQDARELLPLCTATTVIYTYTVKEWIRILALRYYGATGAPHPNAKIIAGLIRNELIKLGYNVDKLVNTILKSFYKESLYNVY